MQTKAEFVCPTEQIAALRMALPRVRGVVTIGWRGAEEHFGHLLRDGLPPETPAFVVTESDERSQETSTNLVRAGSLFVEPSPRDSPA
jgi:hypothetical protein